LKSSREGVSLIAHLSEFFHPMMPKSSLSSIPSGVPAIRAATPQESAHYTYDMLQSLMQIALDQRQIELALLIEAAASKARAGATAGRQASR
jgi:hypothetical protein